MVVRRHRPAAGLARAGLWVFAALLMGAAGMRIATTGRFHDARLMDPEPFRPATFRGL